MTQLLLKPIQRTHSLLKTYSLFLSMTKEKSSVISILTLEDHEEFEYHTHQYGPFSHPYETGAHLYTRAELNEHLTSQVLTHYILSV